MFNLQSTVARLRPGPYPVWMKTPSSDALTRLFDLIRTLRAPGGCPWDREQRFEDVLSDLVEEAYELQWAASRARDDEVRDEMGDVLFLVCFALVIRGETHPDFTLDAIAGGAWEKIYRRHPHVFGDETARTSQESVAHWERIKAVERSNTNAGAGALEGIAGNLPALRRAEKLQERAAATGFDWDNIAGVLDKLREEVDELAEAIHANNRAEITSELGDVLFSAVNVGRFLKIDVEGALGETNARFTRRFENMEKQVARDGRDLDAMPLSEMDAYWERAKRGEPR